MKNESGGGERGRVAAIFVVICFFVNHFCSENAEKGLTNGAFFGILKVKKKELMSARVCKMHTRAEFMGKFKWGKI